MSGTSAFLGGTFSPSTSISSPAILGALDVAHEWVVKSAFDFYAQDEHINSIPFTFKYHPRPLDSKNLESLEMVSRTNGLGGPHS